MQSISSLTVFSFNQFFPEAKLLDAHFYLQNNVTLIAQQLLGKIIITYFDGVVTAGRIVETEAYEGITDKASHAYNARRTLRTEVMYANGGVAYVYLCYGIHHLFNVVTNVEGIPHAVLIRAIEPVLGIEYMLQRTGRIKPDFNFTSGPGNVSKALKITTALSGASLIAGNLLILDDAFSIPKKNIIATPRIGVSYAGKHAAWPYRFFIKNNAYVSAKNKIKN